MCSIHTKWKVYSFLFSFYNFSSTDKSVSCLFITIFTRHYLSISSDFYQRNKIFWLAVTDDSHFHYTKVACLFFTPPNPTHPTLKMLAHPIYRYTLLSRTSSFFRKTHVSLISVPKCQVPKWVLHFHNKRLSKDSGIFSSCSEWRFNVPANELTNLLGHSTASLRWQRNGFCMRICLSACMCVKVVCIYRVSRVKSHKIWLTICVIYYMWNPLSF